MLWPLAGDPGLPGAVEGMTGFLSRFLRATAQLPAPASGAWPLPPVPLPLAQLLSGHSRPLRLPGFHPGLCGPSWLGSRGLAGRLGHVRSTGTHRQLRGCLAWIHSSWRLKERSHPLRKGQGRPTADGSAAAQSPLSSSLSPVPYRLEADEVSVPLCLGVDDSPFLLLSLENQAQFFLVLQHLGIWPVWLLSRRKQGRVRALSTPSVDRQWQGWEYSPNPSLHSARQPASSCHTDQAYGCMGNPWVDAKHPTADPLFLQ